MNAQTQPIETAAEMYARTEKDDLFIECASGKNFHINNPVFDIEDIAHALSQQCRYTGHTRTFYSVADHSMLVAFMLRHDGHREFAFEGLMHDAAEAYLSDIAAPWKVLLPDYKILEKRIENPLREHYGLPKELSPIVKKYDWVALFVEAHYLIPSKAKAWVSPPGIREVADRFIKLLERQLLTFFHEPCDIDTTRAAFLKMFERLQL